MAFYYIFFIFKFFIRGISIDKERKGGVFMKKDKDKKKDTGTGSYKMHLDSKLEDTATDVYYNTKCRTKDAGVAIPTEDAVDEAKKWVDDENKM